MVKILKGKILKLNMQKTATIGIGIQKPHPLYHKIQKKTIKLKAHCEDPNLKIGDLVSIQEVKPIGKTKNWIVISN